MFLIIFLVAMQIISPTVYAAQTNAIQPAAGVSPESAAVGDNSSKEKDKKHDNNHEARICYESCRQKAKELPTCHDPACKKQNYAEIQKCEAECKAKEIPASVELTLSPCILKCKNEDEIKRVECGFIDQACLQNAEMQAQMCVQSCQMKEAALQAANAAN